jgi:CBS domain-containing protein
MARRYGIKVRDITLLPIGGVASLSGVPENPHQEFVISIVGPLFNFGLAAILGVPLILYLGWDKFLNAATTFPEILAYGFWANVCLGAFNLLPAFPMDGGRALRAFLASRMEYQKATHIATVLGQVFAFIFAVIGFKYNIILFFIGLFIFFGAGQEEASVQIRTILRRFRVRDILAADTVTITPYDTMELVLEIMFHHHQEDFAVVDGGKLVGFLSRKEILKGLRLGRDTAVSSVMRKDFPLLSPSESLADVQTKFYEGGVKALPVVYGEKPIGVVTLEDLGKIYLFMSSNK